MSIVNSCIEDLIRIKTSLGSTSPNDQVSLTLARSIIRSLNQNNFTQQADSIPYRDRVFLIEGLQLFAYNEPDAGAIDEVASWCESQWLNLLERDESNFEALYGTLTILPCSIRELVLT